MTLRPLLPVALALLLAAPAAAPANPLAANSLGSGTIVGSLACGSSATATGTVFNTVITGYVGSFSVTASCDDTYVLTATGNALTGSTLRCPRLAGTPAEVVGECRINNYPTTVRWRFAGTAFTVEKAA